MLTHRSLLSMGNVLVLYFNLFILDDDGDPPVDVQLCLSSYFAADRPLLLAYEGLRSIFRYQTFFSKMRGPQNDWDLGLVPSNERLSQLSSLV